MDKKFSQSKSKDENRARTKFHLSISTEGAPVYEQKSAALAARSAESAVLRMARAERTLTFL